MFLIMDALGTKYQEQRLEPSIHLEFVFSFFCSLKSVVELI